MSGVFAELFRIERENTCLGLGSIGGINVPEMKQIIFWKLEIKLRISCRRLI
jgi:hypothetical protein